MQEHFGKEEEVLFRIADNLLSPEEQAAIAADFEKLEVEKIGSGKHPELEALMKELIARNGRR
jgi:hemerythrin-like domain-containing protein